jgi:hypothetical protein
MDPFLSGIIAALVAGATATAQDLASDAVKGAYQGLKRLVIQKLGKGGAVQSVEDEPDSEHAQATLIQALARTNLKSDEEIKASTTKLEAALTAEVRDKPELGNINIQTVRGKVNALVQDLVARGSITLGPVLAETGDATVRGLSAGGVDTPGAPPSKN